MAQLVGASTQTPNASGLNSQSEHIPKLQVQSPVGIGREGNQEMFLSHINVCLSLFPNFLSLKYIFLKVIKEKMLNVRVLRVKIQ